jgi:NAD(P)H dehydrogenase (quinone)
VDGVVGNTDASGQLGRRVAERVARRGLPQRLLVQDSASPPELPAAEVRAISGYDDVAAVAAAVAGVDTLFLIPIKERPDRAQVQAAAVDAAVAGGVGRIVYSSFLGATGESAFPFARDHYETEEHIKRTGLPFVLVRGSAFLEVVHWLIGSDGVIRGPAGNGRLAPVSRDDLADTIAAILAEPEQHDGRTYEVTGPSTLSLQDIAAIFARASGRAISYVEETPEEAWASRRGYNAPDWQVEAWVGTYLMLAAGDMDVVTDTVPRLTGHPAQSLPAYLAEHPEDYAGLLT